MKEKRKFKLIITFVSFILIFVTTGCASKTPMPVLEKAMNEANVTMEQVCKGAGFWTKRTYGAGEECNTFFYPSIEMIEDGVKFKQFETTCNELNGRINFEERERDFHCDNAILGANVVRPSHGYSFRLRDRFYTDARPAIAEKKAKAEAEVKIIEENKKRILEREREKIAAKEKRVEDNKKAKILAEQKSQVDLKEVEDKLEKLGVSSETNLKKSSENIKTYAGVKFGDKIENYIGSTYGSYFIDIRGRGIAYSYADFIGNIISSKKNDKIDTISISKSFNTNEELNKLKESFNSKYKFIEKIEKVEYHYLYKENYKETTYLYDDEGVQIKLIESDYTKFEDPSIDVTLEYLSKNRVNEIKLEKEQEKIEIEKRSNKIKKETSGL